MFIQYSGQVSGGTFDIAHAYTLKVHVITTQQHEMCVYNGITADNIDDQAQQVWYYQWSHATPMLLYY